jgi:hypothetical protein
MDSQATNEADGGCFLLLKDDGTLPGGIWNWKVYVDGNVHSRGPGSTRKTLLKLYGLLTKGSHRIVIREFEPNKPDRIESNTLCFTVVDQSEVVISVSFDAHRPIISLDCDLPPKK